MKILSWNIWAHNHNIEIRTNIICDYILEKDPDIICLQEVLPQSWKIIKDRLEHCYKLAFPHIYKNNSSARVCGEMILSKLPIVDSGFHCLSSYQGRVNSWIKVKVDNTTIVVNTGHLESFRKINSHKLRQKQLDQIYNQNEHNEHWLWIGDTNLESNENKRDIYLPEPTFYANRLFHTRNLEANYDGVWLHGVKLSSWSKIKGIDGDDNLLSDHDGIYIEL